MGVHRMCGQAPSSTAWAIDHCMNLPSARFVAADMDPSLVTGNAGSMLMNMHDRRVSLTMQLHELHEL